MSKARMLGMPSRPVLDKVCRKDPFRKNGKRGLDSRVIQKEMIRGAEQNPE